MKSKLKSIIPLILAALFCYFGIAFVYGGVGGVISMIHKNEAAVQGFAQIGAFVFLPVGLIFLLLAKKFFVKFRRTKH